MTSALPCPRLEHLRAVFELAFALRHSDLTYDSAHACGLFILPGSSHGSLALSPAHLRARRC